MASNVDKVQTLRKKQVDIRRTDSLYQEILSKYFVKGQTVFLCQRRDLFARYLESGNILVGAKNGHFFACKEFSASGAKSFKLERKNKQY